MSDVKQGIIDEGRDFRNVISFFIPANDTSKPRQNSTSGRGRSQSPMHDDRPRSSLTKSSPLSKELSSSFNGIKRNSSKRNMLNHSAPDLTNALPETNTNTKIPPGAILVRRHFQFLLDQTNRTLDELYQLCSTLKREPFMDNNEEISSPVLASVSLCNEVLASLEVSKQDFQKLIAQTSGASSASTRIPVTPQRGGSARHNRSFDLDDSRFSPDRKSNFSIVARSLFQDSDDDSEDLDISGSSAATLESDVLKRYNYSKITPSPSRISLQARLSSPSRKKQLSSALVEQALQAKQRKAQESREQRAQSQQAKLRAKHVKMENITHEKRQESATKKENLADRLAKADEVRGEVIEERRKKAENQNQKVDEIQFMNALNTEMKLNEMKKKLEDADTLREQALELKKKKASITSERHEAALEKRKIMEMNQKRNIQEKIKKDEARRQAAVASPPEEFYCTICKVKLMTQQHAITHTKTKRHVSQLKEQNSILNDDNIIMTVKEWEIQRLEKLSSTTTPAFPTKSKWSVRTGKKKALVIKKLIESDTKESNLQDMYTQLNQSTNHTIRNKVVKLFSCMAEIPQLAPYCIVNYEKGIEKDLMGHAIPVNKKIQTNTTTTGKHDNKNISSTVLASIQSILKEILSLPSFKSMDNSTTVDLELAQICILLSDRLCKTIVVMNDIVNNETDNNIICLYLRLLSICCENYMICDHLVTYDCVIPLIDFCTLSLTDGLSTNSTSFISIFQILTCILKYIPSSAVSLYESKVTSLKHKLITYIILSGVIYKLARFMVEIVYSSQSIIEGKDNKNQQKRNNDKMKNDKKKNKKKNKMKNTTSLEAKKCNLTDHDFHFHLCKFVEIIVHLGFQPTPLQCVESPQERIQLDEKRFSRLINILDETGMGGILSLIPALTVPQDVKTNTSSPPKDMMNTKSILICTVAFRTLNHMSIKQTKSFQKMCSSYRIQLYHCLAVLLPFCSAHFNNVPEIPDLLNELLIFIRYYTYLNEENQSVFRWGQAPTLLETLCKLPLLYFTDTKLNNLLFPSLISVTFRNHANLTILVGELNSTTLVTFLQSQLTNQVKNPALAESMISEGMEFFANK